MVEPEWLDMLPAADPRAQRSRRELARVNALMANASIVAARLRAGAIPSPIVDLGAGDGRFTLRFLRALGKAPPGARVTLVDPADCAVPSQTCRIASGMRLRRPVTAR